MHRYPSRFFFSRLRASQDLHSFPTRRSSDLLGMHRPAGDVEQGMDLRDGAVNPPPGAHFSPVKEDRKSTRLNSSHTVISYAVFCLKKKNTSALCSSINCGSVCTRASWRRLVR